MIKIKNISVFDLKINKPHNLISYSIKITCKHVKNHPEDRNFFTVFAVKTLKLCPMIRNMISFNNLVAKISECRKKMTLLRNEILTQEESEEDTELNKRELFNLRNQINQLQSKLQTLSKRSKIYL